MKQGDLGVDFSMARPVMPGSGAKFAIRYSAGAGMASNTNTHPKLITPAEFKQLLADGFDVIANSEWYETRVTEGAAAGAADGAADLALWKACGLNKGSTIYVSWDAYPDPAKWPAVDAYLSAYRQALGGYYELGAYAGTPYLKHALGKGLIRHGWRPNAGSWSNDGLPYQPDTSTPEKRAALVAKAQAVLPDGVALWQTGNYWFGKSADEDLVVRSPIGSHLEAVNVPVPKPTPSPIDDLPTSGELAVRFSNPETGGKRSAAGWLIRIVQLLLAIQRDTQAIRKKLNA